MELSMLKCPECRLTFGVDKKAIGDDEEDEAVVR